MGAFAGVETNWAALTDIGRTHVATKGIVQSGLVLNLDAGVSSSYSGSGTSWTDLSGNGNTGTLTNGPTYSSANGGSIVFDGVDDYVSTNSSSSIVNLTEVTAELFVKINGTSSGSLNWGGQYLIFKRNSRTSNFEGFQVYYLQNYKLFATTSTPSTGSTQASTYSNTIVNLGQIYHVCGTFKSNDSLKLYINGNLESTTNISFNLDIPSTPILKIGRSVEGFEGPANATIYTSRVYNRALTASEISQNFNAMRYRFGI